MSVEPSVRNLRALESKGGSVRWSQSLSARISLWEASGSLMSLE